MHWLKENRFYFAVILLLLLIMALRTPLDSDMWWHLRAGGETWTSRQVYRVDSFSSTRAGSAWINHSWLSQVLMYLLFRAGSYWALSAWVAVSAVVSMAMVYLQMDGHPLLRGAVLILAGTVASVVWSARPQLISLVLFGVVSYLIYLYKWEGKNRLFWLGPVFLAWGNLHAGYVLGIILLGTVIAGELLNKILPGGSAKGLDWHKIGTLVAWTGAGLLAVLVNPFGTSIWQVPFNTVGLEVLQDLISEWASPDFHQVFQQPLLAMVFLLLISLGISSRKIDGADLVAVLVFSWLAFTARRNFGPFAMVAAPVISRHLAQAESANAREVLARLTAKFSRPEGVSPPEISPNARAAINTGLICLLLLVAAWKTYQVNQADFIRQAESKLFPAGAVAFLKEANPAGDVFNEYNWGGYLIWNLPEYPVFVDGRTDLYGDAVLQDYLAVMAADPGWSQVLEDYRVNLLLLRADSWLARAAQTEGWGLVYQDQVAVVLTR